MIFFYYILAAMLIYFSYKSFRGGINYLNYFREELAKPRSEYTPFATVLAPCKGLDDGLSENLSALLEQDYPEYEVVFVVDDERDSAVPVIQKLSASRRLGGERLKLVIAPKAIDSSQKVGNLREAVLHVSDESRVFVFVDSDARPAKDWLRYLVAPLEDKNIGTATGYRWFISKNPSFASELRSVWNASIASALGANTRSNFCWGGSMAVRRDTFERLAIREKWLGTLSDDFVVTRAMHEANLPIFFVPQALTASVENCTFSELLEFTTRQMKITRVYAPKLWMMSFFGSGLFNVVMIWAALIVLVSDEKDIAFWASVVTLLTVTALSIGKSSIRLKAVKLVLTSCRPAIERQFWTQNTLWLLAPALFFCNSFSALISRKMRWRGITYHMVSAAQTRVVKRSSGEETQYTRP